MRRRYSTAAAAPAIDNRALWVLVWVGVAVFVLILVYNNWASFRPRPYYGSGPSLHYHEGTTVTNTNVNNTQIQPAASPVVDSTSTTPSYSSPSATSEYTPTNSTGTVQVNGYYRKDGTYVRGYTRRR